MPNDEVKRLEDYRGRRRRINRRLTARGPRREKVAAHQCGSLPAESRRAFLAAAESAARIAPLTPAAPGSFEAPMTLSRSR